MLASAIQVVLVVDDDPCIRTVVELSLRAVGGWQVHLASSGDRAIALATELRPDVILLDMMMPEKDGLATLDEFKRLPNLRGVPVIFLSAKAQRSEVERYRACGAIGVIEKPFDPMLLPQQVGEVFAEAARLSAGSPGNEPRGVA